MAERYPSYHQMPSYNACIPSTEVDFLKPANALIPQFRSTVPGVQIPQTGTVKINLSGRSLPRFLINLWTMLNDESINSIIWSGVNSFMVTSGEALSRNVLPKFFKHNRLTSFTRQLHLYQFEKVKDKGTLEWKHVYLNRGNPNLLFNIRRRQNSEDQKLKQITEDLLKKVQLQHQEILKIKYRMGSLENELKRGRELRASMETQLLGVREVIQTLTYAESSLASKF